MDTQSSGDGNVGLWPQVFNIAPRAKLQVNATCGQQAREEYCKTIDAHPERERKPHCGFCDAHNPDPDRRHPIENVVDSTKRWWQSPTLHEGPQYEHVTITMDLRQVNIHISDMQAFILWIICQKQRQRKSMTTHRIATM